MKIRYFEDTDTLYIEFWDREIVETRDLDENTTIDVDAERESIVFNLPRELRATDATADA